MPALGVRERGAAGDANAGLATSRRAASSRAFRSDPGGGRGGGAMLERSAGLELTTKWPHSPTRNAKPLGDGIAATRRWKGSSAATETKA